MGYIGTKPSAVPLTSADITDGIITSAKIANDAIVTGKIADGTIVNADISSSAAIVSTKLSGVNDAKAWVNFNGTGTVAVRASYNVSSITDVATGRYRVNFTTSMTDTNYSAFITSGQNTQSWGIPMYLETTPFLVGSIGISLNDPSDSDVDNSFISVSVFNN
ncbi:MAG: hypothetical protein FJ336_07660 [Sphingomonadales bacterium]|nr:hypothetical protein [Sphingomonadales bacterium]